MTLKKIKKSAWFKSRPQKIKEAILAYPPNQKYQIQGKGFPGHLYSYEEHEDGYITVKINIESPFFPRQVFGVPLTDLVPFNK